MRNLIAFLIPLAICAGIVTVVNYASADETSVIAQADTGSSASGAGSAPAPDTAQPAAAPTPAAPAAAPTQLQASDVGLVAKLYKNGAFFGLGIMALFLGLTVWAKVDKKRAFYASTLLGGVGLLVESIRRGDTPSVMMLYSTLTPTIGILIAGPNHVRAPDPGGN